MTTGSGRSVGKLVFLGRTWFVVLTATSVLVAGAWALPLAIGTGPVLDAGSERPVSPELIVLASETAKVSPPLDVNTRLPMEELSAQEQVAAGLIPSSVGVVDKTAEGLPSDGGDLSFGELRVLLESGEIARFSWQRWDPVWDFGDFAGANPRARQVDLGEGRLALYMDAGGSRRSVTLWTGDLLVTITVRSASDGTAPTTDIDQVAEWTIDFADRLAKVGL